MVEQDTKKKSNKGVILLIIFLILIILALVGYICYDKGIIFNNTQEQEVEDNTQNNKTEELDINSRMIQELYHKVSTTSTGGCYANWMYGESGEFDIETSSEITKMNIVGYNLSTAMRTIITCDENTNIPDTITNHFGATSQSICKMYQNDGLNPEYAYSKAYIEYMYHNIFGDSKKFDSSVVVGVDSLKTYKYIEALNAYVLYDFAGGGTCEKPNDYKLIKAIKNDNKIKLYEEETNSISNETTTYVYTFELEDDGLYSFISRIKEN